MKALGELTDQKKLLIKEVKSLRRRVAQTEKETNEYQREFELLKEMVERTRGTFQDEMKELYSVK